MKSFFGILFFLISIILPLAAQDLSHGNKLRQFKDQSQATLLKKASNQNSHTLLIK
jgi:hypothetical protein